MTSSTQQGELETQTYPTVSLDSEVYFLGRLAAGPKRKPLGQGWATKILELKAAMMIAAWGVLLLPLVQEAAVT